MVTTARGARDCGCIGHKGDVARIEVPLDNLPQFVEPKLRNELITVFRALGFKFITLDLEGFRSGSLNSIITPEHLLQGITRTTVPSARSQ